MVKIDYSDVEFTATRSSGPGGQHVNKTNSCIQLRFSVLGSQSLSEEQKQKILVRLKNRIVQEDVILIRVETERDQKSNKDTAFRMLHEMINRSLIDPKKRKATKPTKSSVRKRLDTKKKDSSIKKMRSEKIKW